MINVLVRTLKQTRVVQIGIGGWGKHHARILNEIGVLTAVCDPSEKVKKEFTEKYPNINYYKTVVELIDNEEFEVAFVTTPTDTHYQIVKMLLNHKKHVFVEKPLTKEYSDGEELVRLSHENQMVLTCGYIERFNPVVKQLSKITDESKYNDLIMLQFNRENKLPEHINDVGIILDTMVHDIDTACHIFEDYPKQVFATTGRIKRKHEDFAVIVLKFKNNKIATLVANWITPNKIRTITAIYEDAVVTGDFISQQIIISNKKMSKSPKIDYEEPLKNEITHFLKCIKHGWETPFVSPEQALMVTKIAEACLKSVKDGKPIAVK